MTASRSRVRLTGARAVALRARWDQQSFGGDARIVMTASSEIFFEGDAQDAAVVEMFVVHNILSSPH